MSSPNHDCPPTYATAFPSPDYSRDPTPTEQLVESSISPPPYADGVSRLTSTSPGPSSSVDHGAASRPYTPPVNSDAIPRPRYIYTSGNVQLDLGERDENRAIPSYGRRGLVRGVVRLGKLSHVRSVVVTVSDTVPSTRFMA
jgi:hypothetical protein